MKWRLWFWRCSVVLGSGAVLLVSAITWVPAEQAIRSGTATRNLLLMTGTYLFAPLFVGLARLIKNGGPDSPGK